MDHKINLSQLTELFCEVSGLGKGVSTAFVKSFFETIIEEVSAGEQVRIKGFGAFKQILISDRESVNVNTGERIVIHGHQKISFTPEPELKAFINKPFNSFETVLIDTPVQATKEKSVTPEQETLAVDNPEPEPTPEVGTEAEPEPILEQETEPEPKSEAEEPEPKSEAEEPELKSEAEKPELESEPESESESESESKPEPEADTVPTEPDISANDKKSKSKPARRFRSLLTVCIILLTILIVSYCVWPLNIIHTMRKGMEFVERSGTDNAKESSVKSVDIVRLADTATVQETAKDGQEPETAVQSDSILQSENVSQTSESKTQETELTLTESDAAKPLAQFTVSDTTSYRMTDVILATHVLESGETLARISLRYYGTKKLWPYIAAYNKITDANSTSVGMNLKIPVLVRK